MKISLLGAIKLAELRPKNLIDEVPRRPDHDGVAPGMRRAGALATARSFCKREKILDLELRDKIVIVTGGNRGIDKAVAWQS
jgi:hypothetical protein